MSEYDFISKVIEITEEMTTGINDMTDDTKVRVFEVYSKEMNKLIKDWRDEE